MKAQIFIICIYAIFIIFYLILEISFNKKVQYVLKYIGVLYLLAFFE